MGPNNKLNKGICTNVQEEEVPTLGKDKKKITRSVFTGFGSNLLLNYGPSHKHRVFLRLVKAKQTRYGHSKQVFMLLAELPSGFQLPLDISFQNKP